jgi:hypothetical protein
MLKIVRVHREKTEPNLNLLLLAVGVLGTLTFSTTILTYQDFFLFNPLESEDPTRRIFLLLTTVGWVTSLVGPIVVLLLNTLGKPSATQLLALFALAWPVSLIINHLALLIQTHKLFLGYLGVYPIFIVTDIALPLLYVLIARFLNQKKD